MFVEVSCPESCSFARGRAGIETLVSDSRAQPPTVIIWPGWSQSREVQSVDSVVSTLALPFANGVGLAKSHLYASVFLSVHWGHNIFQIGLS